MFSFMLNSNLLRTCRWEWTRTELRRKLHQDRLRDLTKFGSLLLVIALSLSTIKEGKKQIAFIISQICLLICVYILITNIPPILLEIFNSIDIFELGSAIVIFVIYCVILGFLFFILILSWYSVYQRYQDEYGDHISKYLQLTDNICPVGMFEYDPENHYCSICFINKCPFDKKLKYHIIPIDDSDIIKYDGKENDNFDFTFDLDFTDRGSNNGK